MSAKIKLESPETAQALQKKALAFAAMTRLQTRNYKVPGDGVFLSATEAAYIARGIEAFQLELNRLKDHFTGLDK